MVGTVKAVVIVAGAIAVSVAFWSVVVQPNIDLALQQRDEAQRQAEAADRRFADAQTRIAEMERELEHRQQVLDALEAFKESLSADLQTTETRLQEAINNEISPELAACFDMPVDAFHRSVRNVPEAAPASD